LGITLGSPILWAAFVNVWQDLRIGICGSSVRVRCEQLPRIGDLPGQFSEPHAPAKQERTVGLNLGPGGTEKAPAHQVLEHWTRYAEISRQIFWWRASSRLFVPSASNSTTKINAPIRIDRGFQTVVDKFILLAHPSPDRVGHSTRRPAMDPSRDGDPDCWVMPNASVYPSERLDETTIFA
jgi:hypothetical protein